MKTIRNAKKDVVDIIIEPITAFENAMATPYFYRRLRKILEPCEIRRYRDFRKTRLVLAASTQILTIDGNKQLGVHADFLIS